MKNSILTFVRLFVFYTAFLTGKIYSYESGVLHCQNNPPIGHRGMFHEIDSSLQIYSYSRRDINPLLPTILFVTGGPGVSSLNSDFELEKFNVIFFEQRGIGCSKPHREKDYLDPNFYSSKKSVEDMKVILRDYRKKFQLSSFILYGHSYGTILTTMYASLYPDEVSKIVLEGTIGENGVHMWKSEHRRKNLQEVFHSLTPEDQRKILFWSNDSRLPSTWFSSVGRMMLYLNQGKAIFKNLLSNILSMEEESFVSFIKTLTQFQPNHVFSMITCQELRPWESTSTMLLNFSNNNDGILEWSDKLETYEESCVPLSLTEQWQKPLRLEDYPVTRPILYLIGEDDGATDLTLVNLHRKKIARGKTMALMQKSGGHLPNLDALINNRKCQDVEDCKTLSAIKTQVNLFEKILKLEIRQSKLPFEKLLDEANPKLESPWIIVP